MFCPHCPEQFVRLTACAVLFALLPATVLAQPNDVWRTRIGYYDLLAEYGVIEDGTGIALSIAEGDTTPANPALFQYMPDTTLPQFATKTITDGSGLQNTTPSSHATSMVRHMFGDLGVSQGATAITVYESGDYLNRVLGFAGGTEPLAQPFLVQNHSWVGNVANTADAENVLQRLDYLIERDGISVAVGLNNGSGTSIPHLMAHSYNSISVGLIDGNHSRGTTTIYGAGRTKPDIVSEGVFTSGATAEVSSVLTVLHHKAINDGNADASRPETMKAILMAGANKRSLPGWDRTTTRPLDDVFGAGEVNLYNSYKILEGGETDGLPTAPIGATIGAAGYDYGENIAAGDSLFWNFEVAAGTQWNDLSILLTWNREVTDGDPGALFSPVASTLADMSLFLYDATGAPVLLDSSLSTVDNVEHIFVSGLLGQGLYTIEVSSNLATDFGLAWYAQVIPEPNAAVFLSIATVISLATRRRRRQQLKLQGGLNQLPDPMR